MHSMPTYTVINPATEQPVTHRRVDLGARRPTRRSSGPPPRRSTWRAVAPGDRAAAAAPRSPPWSTRTSRSWPRWRCASSGHTDRQRPLGGRQRPRRAGLLRGARRSGCSAGRSRWPAAWTSRSTSRSAWSALIVPWNFPMPIAGLGLRPGAGRRQHGRAQAGRADPADRDPARRAGPRGRAARGRVPGAAGQGQRGRPAVRRPPAGPQDRVHRVDRGRQADHGAAAPTRSSGSRWSSAARAPTSCSPTPTWSRPRPPRRTAVFDNAGQDCCARSRILVQRSVLRPVHGAARAGGARASGSATRRCDGHRDGPADLRRAPGARGLLRAGRRAGGVPRHRAGRARLLVPADRAGPGRRDRPGLAPRRSSARW